ERRTLLESLGALYVFGHPIEWKKLYPQGGRCVSLPSYPWRRKRYWIDGDGEGRPPTLVDAPARISGFPKRLSMHPEGTSGHPLLGARFTISTQPATYAWENSLSIEALPYLSDHRVRGDAVLPGAAYVEMALAAAA